MLEEHVILHENDVLVTNARFVIDEEETYAISGMVSLKLKRGSRRVYKTKLVAGLVVGLLGMVATTYQPYKTLAFILIVVGLGWMALSIRKYPHSIEFRMSSGEVEIYSDENRVFVEKVFKALNEAIIFRG